jgi:hypothetical protein
MKLYIECGTCEEIMEVWGPIWEFRLSRSPFYEKGKKRIYTGWNCESCADQIERGGY